MKRIATFLLLIFMFLISLNCTEQNKKEEVAPSNFYVANWNIENLFDTIDNPDKNDESFTPDSEKKWTNDKLDKKLNNLAQVISLMNDGQGPDLLGLEEVENEFVLNLLLSKIMLQKNYKIMHKESPDKRGIDNALIYNADMFSVKKTEALNIELGDGKTTRDILYSILEVKDYQLHVFVNHWSSRREGLKKTEKRRIKAAETLMNKLQKIKNLRESNIIIMGDFNDLPSNISISNIIGAQEFNCKNTNSNKFTLFNLSYEEFQKGNGTYKYRDHWNMLDQIIISNALSDGNNLSYKCDSFEIIKPSFLIQQSGKYKGTSLPTYGGRKYLGGYSDHFSIGAKFNFKSESK